MARAGLGFELGRPHVLGRRVHKIADHQHGRRLGQRRLDPCDVLRQQDARFGVLCVLAVAVEPVLSGDPAVKRLPRFTARAAIDSTRQDIGELGHAPRRKVADVGDARNDEPAVAIRNNRMFVTVALELLRGERRTLSCVEALDEIRQRRLVDKVDGNGLLAAIWLDQRVFVGHVGQGHAAERGPLREEIA